LRVPSEELRRLVAALPGFVDDPAAADEAELEEIQSAWFDAAQES
jgi:FeS assembly protein IscX